MSNPITADQGKIAQKRRLADALRANLKRRKTAALRTVDRSIPSPQPPNGHDRRSGDDDLNED